MKLRAWSLVAVLVCLVGVPAAAEQASLDVPLAANRSCEASEEGIVIGDVVLMNLPPGALVPSEPELKQVAVCNCSSTICLQPFCAPPKTCQAVPCLTQVGSCLNRHCR